MSFGKMTAQSAAIRYTRYALAFASDTPTETIMAQMTKHKFDFQVTPLPSLQQRPRQCSVIYQPALQQTSLYWTNITRFKESCQTNFCDQTSCQTTLRGPPAITAPLHQLTAYSDPKLALRSARQFFSDDSYTRIQCYFFYMINQKLSLKLRCTKH